LILGALASRAVTACDGREPSGFTSDPATTTPAGDGGVVVVSQGGAPSSGSASSPLDDAGGEPSAPGDDGATLPPPESPPDAPDAGLCASPLSIGDLRIVEILIESVAGTGDHGEWLEVQSTLDCTLDLRGLHGECGAGAKVSTIDVTGDVLLAPHGTFLITDSTDPAIEHDLSGLRLPWSGEPGDVLRNQGGTVTLRWQGSIVDSITYPAEKLKVGTSLAFPSDCADALRSDWTQWQASTSSWFPGFFGTPNAPNDDVHCAPEPEPEPEPDAAP
jgi:hypothetical protein